MDLQQVPVLQPQVFQEAASDSTASGPPGGSTASGPPFGSYTAVHHTLSSNAASSASLSSMPSMPGEMPGEAAAQGVPILAERLTPQRFGSDRLAGSPRPGETFGPREGTTEVRREGSLMSNDSGIFFTQWRGRCGYMGRLRPDTPDGPWMCHHFTVDGEHCVGSGLGPEHANRCAGVCRINETETFEDLADPPRCMGLRKPHDGPGCPTLIKCCLASSSVCCSPDTCPFLAQRRQCPFVKRAAQHRRAEEQTTMRFSPEPTPHAATRQSGGHLRGGGDGILIEPEPDDDMSPFDNNGRIPL